MAPKSKTPYRDERRREAVAKMKELLGESFTEDMIHEDLGPNPHDDFLDMVLIVDLENRCDLDDSMMELATKFMKDCGIDLRRNGTYYDKPVLQRLRKEWKWDHENGEFRRV
ncbi:hypothetical protein BGX21_004049 [Mortierella sp. AD011]|nr:hypothetical protein BGX20_003957 [Mortierella sp. AD010]KAF9374742.1 hypothetical protein BGX21_004049 [Mortierella sp. AD011]